MVMPSRLPRRKITRDEGVGWVKATDGKVRRALLKRGGG
jgi:hypothetical protein